MANQVVRAVCPISRQEFKAGAQDLAVTIEGKPLMAEVKEFSTGSLGWYTNGRIILEIGGHRVSCQVGLTITLVASKDLPKE